MYFVCVLLVIDAVGARREERSARDRGLLIPVSLGSMFASFLTPLDRSSSQR
jgi:hypothetical protein